MHWDSKCNSPSCVWLCDPMDCTVHGILQARILQWVTVPFSRGSSQSRDRTQVSHMAGGFFASWATREALRVPSKKSLKWKFRFSSVQLLSRVQLFVTPWIAAHQASLSITNSQSPLKLTSIESVMPSSHLTLCRPLLLLPPIPPSIRVFSNESILCMRWPKYWSFSFSISPSKEIPGLISFRIDWLDLLGTYDLLRLCSQEKGREKSRREQMKELSKDEASAGVDWPLGSSGAWLQYRVIPLETSGLAFYTLKSVSHWQWATRRVSQSLCAAITKTTDCVAYKQQKFICHSVEAGGLRSKYQHGGVRAHLWVADFSLYCHW